MSSPSPTLPAEKLRSEFDSSFAAPPSDRGQDVEAFLTMRIASTPYAMRLLDVTGFATARTIAPLASTLPALLGLAAVRGSLFPAYSLEALLGYETAGAPPRWFALSGGSDPVALAFTQFEGHVLVSRSARVPATGSHRAHIQEIVRSNGEVRGVIDVASLVQVIHQRVSASKPPKER
ncbi:MAG TPA: chemotaxis protein CheW [Polyangiaceae bacterium]